MTELELLNKLRSDVPLPPLVHTERGHLRFRTAIEAETTLPKRRGRTRPRLAISLAVSLGTTAVLAAVIAVSVVAVGRTGPNAPPVAGPSAGASATEAPAKLPATAKELFTLAAQSSRQREELTLKPGQYIHLAHRLFGSETWSAMQKQAGHDIPKPGEVTQNLWISYDETSPMGQQFGNTGDIWYDCNGPLLGPMADYSYTKGLPTDADGMRKHLYRDGRDDWWAMVEIDRYLRYAYLPPAQQAALFNAAATIPGATVSTDPVQYHGHSGIVVKLPTTEWGEPGTTTSLIFDASTHEALGDQFVVSDSDAFAVPDTPVGTVILEAVFGQPEVVDDLPGRSEHCR